MTELQICGLLALLPLLLPLLFLRWPGHATAPIACLWSLANVLFCAPLAALLASGWVSPSAPAVGMGCLVYALGAMAMGVGLAATELGTLRLGRRRLGLAQLCDQLDLVPDRLALSTSLAIQAIRAYAFIGFGILFSGSRNYSTIDTDLPGWFALLVSFSDLVGYAIFAWAAQRLARPRAPGARRILALSLGLVELVYALMSGRRWMMMLGLLGLLIWWQLRRPSPLRVALAGLLLIGITPLVFLVFVSLRMGNWEARLSADPQAVVDTSRMVDAASVRLADGSALDELSDNLRDRPFGLFSFAGTIYARSERPLFGAALANSLFWALPGNLVDKRGTLMTEELIQQHLGVPFEDTASSWPAFALADLGLGGGLLYGVLLAVVLLAAVQLLPGAREGPGYILVGIVVFFCAFQIEQDPTATFSLIRNVAVLLVPYAIWLRLSRRKPATPSCPEACP